MYGAININDYGKVLTINVDQLHELSTWRPQTNWNGKAYQNSEYTDSILTRKLKIFLVQTSAKTDYTTQCHLTVTVLITVKKFQIQITGKCSWLFLVLRPTSSNVAQKCTTIISLSSQNHSYYSYSHRWLTLFNFPKFFLLLKLYEWKYNSYWHTVPNSSNLPATCLLQITQSSTWTRRTGSNPSIH